jgi:NAD(P)-dependent dehydrogenase (short-subunit alcohol dehydrogenase family)
MAQNKSSRKPLTGRVARVAGATRGAGRGIARALGEAGATVYCTGRSVKGNGFTDYDGRRPDWGHHKIDFSGLPQTWIDLFRTGADLEVKWLTMLAARARKFRAKVPS